jgi:hypothetical protein
MPYINPEERKYMTPDCITARTPGELNFQITSLMISYLMRHGLNYDTINAVVGAAESAKIELYARVARPYEESKINMNGDVYP